MMKISGSLYTVCAKRIFDFILAILALIVTFPLMLTIIVLIKFNSSGPVFYRGIRIGRGGIPFKIFKFRTMIINADKMGGFSTALNDPRLTRTGKVLRKYKLDELPQIFNILSGEMSFVGPRPQVEKYTKLYRGEEKLILMVKPGLTDYSSLHFINLDALLGDDDVDEKYIREIEPIKNKLRIKYVKESSFCVDVKILFMTFFRLLGISSF